MYGIDMTRELVWIASTGAIHERTDNLGFMLGDSDGVPILSDSVDVVITNGVICLSAQKDSICSEVFRILRPGSRFECLDKVADKNAPDRWPIVLSRLVGMLAGP